MRRHLFAAVLFAASLALPCQAQSTMFGVNLVKNGDAESSIGSPNCGAVNAPDWSKVGPFTVAIYGGRSDVLLDASPGPPLSGQDSRGKNFFCGGNGPASNASQTIDVSSEASTIDSGKAAYVFSGWLGGDGASDDNATLSAVFNGQNTTQGPLTKAQLGPVNASDRSSATSLVHRQQAGIIPVGTRSITITLDMQRSNGLLNDAYADNISFVMQSSNLTGSPSSSSNSFSSSSSSFPSSSNSFPSSSNSFSSSSSSFPSSSNSFPSSSNSFPSSSNSLFSSSSSSPSSSSNSLSSGVTVTTGNNFPSGSISSPNAGTTSSGSGNKFGAVAAGLGQFLGTVGAALGNNSGANSNSNSGSSNFNSGPSNFNSGSSNSSGGPMAFQMGTLSMDPAVVKNSALSGIIKEKGKTVITLNSDKMFVQGKSVFIPGVENLLEQIRLTEFNSHKLGRPIFFEAHTDEMTDNLDCLSLTMNRALAITVWMKQHGANTAPFEVRGCGRSMPKSTVVNGNAVSQNRRVEIVLID